MFEYILNPFDIFYITGISTHLPGEIRALIGKEKKYLFVSPLIIGNLTHFTSWVIISDKKKEEKVWQTIDEITTDPDYFTQTDFTNLRKIFAGNISYLPCSVSAMRRRKSSDEVSRIQESQKINEQVLEQILPLIKVGISETSLAQQIHITQLERGAQGYSFPSIVAFGNNAANPHHMSSSDRLLEEDDLILVDMGVKLNGYCSDMTRVIFPRNGCEEARKIYHLLEETVALCKKEIRIGKKWQEIDAFARKKLGTYAKHFTHTLGHGVGIDIHEAPRLSKKSEEVVSIGDVVTLEPGVYVMGEFGLRYEDMIAIGENTEVISLTHARGEIFWG